MTITSILLLFHLPISLIAHMNPFSGCLHCLEVSQVVCDANWLTGFSVMGISVGESSWAIYKIFFVSRILLLLPVLHLALIFLIFMVYLVSFMLYCFSTLVCANLVGNSFGRFACVDLGSMFIDAVPIGLYRCFWPFFCWLGRHIFSKMLVNLIQYCETVGVFNSQHLVFVLKHKIQSLLIHSHSHVFSHCTCFFCNSVLLFLFLAVFLILKLNSCKRSNNSCVSPFLVVVIKTWLATWFYSLLLLLSEDFELNPRPKHNYSNAFSIFHMNLSSLSAHNYAKGFLLKAYIAIHKFDIVCISETYLDSSTPSDVSNLEISGYMLVRSDHPSNKKEGVFVFITKAFYL